MHHELTCNQVNALLSFYLDNRLNETLKQYVAKHLEKCPKCKKKYEELCKMLNKKFQPPADAVEPETKEQYLTRQYTDFRRNLSAYIDNELDDDENIKIKKITISNPLARQDLEKIYTYKKLIHSAFEKTRNDFKDDYTKSVIENISRQSHKKKPQRSNEFLVLISAFSVTIFFLIMSLLWFTVETGLIKFSFRF